MNCKLMIVAGYKKECSYLKDSFQSSPFRLMDVGQYRKDAHLYMMIMSSSPGLLDGDHYDISINVETGASLQLQSQAYQRLFHMEKGASQKMVVHLQSGSNFSFVPHPIVPHKKSKFRSQNIVYLANDCRLLLSEIITCGRKHSGEAFLFSHLQNLTEVYHHHKLLFKDNVWLCPEEVPLATLGQLEGYTHQGTLLYLNTGSDKADPPVELIHELVEKEKDLALGISSLDGNGFVLRLLGNGGEQMFTCFKMVQELLWTWKGEFLTKCLVSKSKKEEI